MFSYAQYSYEYWVSFRWEAEWTLFSLYPSCLFSFPLHPPSSYFLCPVFALFPPSPLSPSLQIPPHHSTRLVPVSLSRVIPVFYPHRLSLGFSIPMVVASRVVSSCVEGGKGAGHPSTSSRSIRVQTSQLDFCIALVIHK
jgi:hypothetical protein